jgi:programmed cell death protein 5
MEGLKELPRGIPAPSGGAQGGEDEAKKAQEEQMRRDIMATVLDTGARERCTLKHFCRLWFTKI